MDKGKIEEVLISIRRIIRAADIHSKKLLRASGLTAPQLLILQVINDLEKVSIGKVAKEVGLTQATVTSIADRLEKRGLITREKSTEDKRKVFVSLTQKGYEVTLKAPTPLQDHFTEQFNLLEPWEQSFVIAALQKVEKMMGAQDIDASPVLDVHSIDHSSKV